VSSSSDLHFSSSGVGLFGMGFFFTGKGQDRDDPVLFPLSSDGLLFLVPLVHNRHMTLSLPVNNVFTTLTPNPTMGKRCVDDLLFSRATAGLTRFELIFLFL